VLDGLAVVGDTALLVNAAVTGAGGSAQHGSRERPERVMLSDRRGAAAPGPPLRNLGSYAWGPAGANQLVGYPDELDVVVLGDPSH
jgi:hypothetical protein